MKLNKQKREIGVQRLDFLSYSVSSLGIDPDGAKVKAVKDGEPTKTIGEMKSLHGLTSYLSEFIPHYSHTTASIRNLIAGKIAQDSVCLSADELTAINQLKADILNTDPLCPFDVNCADTRLFIDASPVGLGAILIPMR